MLACLVVGLLLALLVFLQMREPGGGKQGLVIRCYDASFLSKYKELKDVHFLKDLLKSGRSCELKTLELLPNCNGDCKYIHTG